MGATASGVSEGREGLVSLLPGTGTDDVVRIGERVRAAVEALCLPHAGNPAHGGVVTVSLGVAGASLEEGPQALVAAADRALYDSKNGGRNRATVRDGLRLAGQEREKIRLFLRKRSNNTLICWHDSWSTHGVNRQKLFAFFPKKKRFPAFLHAARPYSMNQGFTVGPRGPG